MTSLKHLALKTRYNMFRLRRRLTGERSIFEVANKVWEIAPPETQKTPPSLFLPGEMDKIRELEFRTTMDVETRRANGGLFERPAIKAYRFSNAVLYKSAVMANGGVRRILPYGMTPPSSEAFPVEEVSEGALAGSYLGLQFFGHWLKDDAPLSLLAADHGDPVSPSPPSWHADEFGQSHIHGYAEMLELPWRQAENVFFKTLIVFDDEDFTTHKGRRLKALRERAAKKFPKAGKKSRVFIKRGIGDSGVRKFANEDLVAEALQAEGFEILDPSKASAGQIGELLSRAELLVGAEGSHQVHGYSFCRPMPACWRSARRTAFAR